MRSDIVEILDYAVSKGFYVTITTNGTLITKQRAAMVHAFPLTGCTLIFHLMGMHSAMMIFVKGCMHARFKVFTY